MRNITKTAALAILLILVSFAAAVPKFIGKGDESAPYILNPWDNTQGCMVNIRVVDKAGLPVSGCNVTNLIGGVDYDLVPTNSTGYSVDYYQNYLTVCNYTAIKGARTGEAYRVSVWPNDGGGNMWVEIVLGD